MFHSSPHNHDPSSSSPTTANKHHPSPPPSGNNPHNSNNINPTIIDNIIRAPPPDSFMSDSPRSQAKAISAQFVEEGLHHRTSTSRGAVSSHNISHRLLPQSISNHNQYNNTARQARLFHSYNPYHQSGNRSGRVTISLAWVLRCMFIGLVISYICLMVYTHVIWNRGGAVYDYYNSNHNDLLHREGSLSYSSGGGVRVDNSDRNFDQDYSHRDNSVEKVVDVNDDNGVASMDRGGVNTEENRIVSLHDLYFRTSMRRKTKSRSDHMRASPKVPFVFDDTLSRKEQYSVKSYKYNDNQNVKNVERVKQMRQGRRQDRKRRTTPPPVNPHNEQQASDAPPPWYNLEHSSQDTITKNQKRWTTDKTSSSSSLPLNMDTTLCGKYAQQASIHHPNNYYPPIHSQQRQQPHVPLNSQSKVLITGILSPLGFHLTLALHRQCNVTNFIGMDAQIPNDPLNRLEMQDRLEVLLEELSNGKKDGSSGKSLWYVPFLGLESKHSKNEPLAKIEERQRREEQLVRIRSYPDHTIIDDATRVDDVSSMLFNAHERYGIPMSPGVNSDGYGALDLIAEYRPTHIVHLARTQSDSLLNSKKYDPHTTEEDGESSVSSRPHMYEFRMGMVGMEQLLSSVIAQSMIPPSSSESSSAVVAPHVVYASSYDAQYFSETSKRLLAQQQNHARDEEIMLGEGDELANRKHHSPPRGFHGVSHLIDEILATTYHGLHRISAIGLRFDAIYGPRGFGAPSTSLPILNVNRMRKNIGVSPDVVLAEVLVRRMYHKWMQMIEDVETDEDDYASLIEEAGLSYASHQLRDFVYVQDAVGAIIAAMQYRAVQGSPTTFNIGSGEMNTLSSFADKLEQAFQEKQSISAQKNVIDVERSNAANSASHTSNEYLGWSAETSLKDGAAKLLAWHLDRALPMFSLSTLSEDEGDYSMNEGVLKPMDGMELLLKNDIESCSPEKGDATCLAEKHTSYPCASECSSMSCTPSIFDEVIPLVKGTTEGCYMVLYTAPLGYDIESLNVETEYSDSSTTFAYHEGTVCTIAFVPSESKLVKKVIDDLPANALSMLDTSPSDSYSEKVKRLNGHLAHKGWLLVFVDDATRPLPPEELLLPKLAPARLFHSTVRRAMYVDESFAHTPSAEDALFLATETYRGVTKSRTIKGPDAKGGETKYKLPEEPQRYAVMLASQMRDISIEEGHKVPLRDVTRAMMNEKGYDENAHEPKEVKAQREFYERSRALINSLDLRSSDSTHRHKIEIKDFIRSQWVLYNLKLEEGHHIRCEWYREHSRWTGSNTLDSGMDQLSFAYVMAKRELARNIINDEPLPKELTQSEKIIRAASDAHEWHPVVLDGGSNILVPGKSSTAKEVPLNIADRPEFELHKVEPETISDDSATSYYVRIMSDEVMLKARKRWSKFVAKFNRK